MQLKYFLFRIRACVLFPDFKIKERKLKFKTEKNSRRVLIFAVSI